jgi:hypothetical protein
MSTKHLIRLRGGWEWHTSEKGSPACGRIALPTVWPQGLSEPFQLVRRFGCPPVDPVRERTTLRLGDVLGLRSVWLNDRLLGQPAEGIDSIEFELGDLLRARNELRLEVDPRAWADLGADAVPWGTIALAVCRT